MAFNSVLRYVHVLIVVGFKTGLKVSLYSQIIGKILLQPNMSYHDELIKQLFAQVKRLIYNQKLYVYEEGVRSMSHFK